MLACPDPGGVDSNTADLVGSVGNCDKEVNANVPANGGADVVDSDAAGSAGSGGSGGEDVAVGATALKSVTADAGSLNSQSKEDSPYYAGENEIDDVLAGLKIAKANEIKRTDFGMNVLDRLKRRQSDRQRDEEPVKAKKHDDQEHDSKRRRILQQVTFRDAMEKMGSDSDASTLACEEDKFSRPLKCPVMKGKGFQCFRSSRTNGVRTFMFALTEKSGLYYRGATKLRNGFANQHKKTFRGLKGWILARVGVGGRQQNTPELVERLFNGLPLTECSNDCTGLGPTWKSRRLSLLVVKPRTNGGFNAYCVSPPLDFKGDDGKLKGMIQKMWAPWWEGGLADIATQGKLLARAGLLFSGEAIGPANFDVVVKDDITGKDVMTDGAGLISADLYEQCVDAMRPECWSRLKAYGCVVQARLCRSQDKQHGPLIVKGTFLRDPSLPARTVVVRPSQVKAGATQDGWCKDPIILVRIADSKKGRMGLMEMFIRESCGTAPSVLIDIVRKANLELLGHPEEPDDTTTRRFMKDTIMKLGKKQRRPVDPDWLSMHMIMFNIRRPGGAASTHLSSQQFSSLEWRWQYTPATKSANFMAMPDHTGTVGIAEVIVKSRHFSDNDVPTYFSGLVSVYRSPALAPGNLRLLQAVVPKPGSPLDILLDGGRGEVAIFSTLGCRSELDRMGGGDFDGDLVIVSWDTRLLPPNVYEAPTYDNVPVEVPSSIERNIAQASLECTQTYAGHLIGTLFMMWQRLVGNGIQYMFSDIAKRLEQLYNVAMDSFKSGAVVDCEEVEKIKKQIEHVPRWNFQRFDAQGRVPVSPTAVGQIADIFQKVCARSASPDFLKLPHDDRLENAWEDRKHTLPSDDQTLLSEMWNKLRRRSFDVLEEDKTTYRGGLWQQFLEECRDEFDKMVVEIAKKNGTEPRSTGEIAALCLYISDKKVTMTFPWRILGDILIEIVKRLSEVPVCCIPTDKLWMLTKVD